jgi:thymidylate synthase
MISPAFAIAEVVWILSGRDDAKFINTWNPILKMFAGDTELYHGAYGHRLRVHMGFDQIERAYETLLHNPLSRQVVMQIWDSKLDLPQVNGRPNSEDIPCNLVSLLKINNGCLEWSQVMRSNDIFRGTPYNFIQFTLLQEIIAGWLNVEMGSFVLFVDSLHAYQNDLNTMKIQESRLCSANRDNLFFSKFEFDQFFPLCMKMLDEASVTGTSINLVNKLKTTDDIPQEYKNLLAIPLAYIAFKEQNFLVQNEFEGICSNEQIKYIWMTWLEEVGKKKIPSTLNKEGL